MKLKLLAPVVTDFAVVTELPIRDPDCYAEFWDDVADRADGLRSERPDGSSLPDVLAAVRFAHASAYRKSPYNRYQSLESNSLERPLHVLELHLDGTAITDEQVPAPASTLAHGVERVVWRVFDHGVSLLEIDVSLRSRMRDISSAKVGAELDELQREGVLLGEYAAGRCYRMLLKPLFAWLRDEVPDGKAFVEMHHGVSEVERSGDVLWVTRTLILESEDAANRKAIIRHWLKNSGGTETQEEGSDPTHLTLSEQVVQHKRHHVMRWLNYLFDETYSARQTEPEQKGLTTTFCDAWEAMLYAQFFYSALDVVDVQLTRILAQSLSPVHDLKIDTLKAILAQNIRKANLLLLQFHDSAKYYKRTVKAELDDVLDYWDFETVLVEPVKRKIVLCQERLTLLHQQEAAKSAVYTDLILLGIGITSIFGTALALADYGRTMANDADLASYDVNSTNFVEWFAALPTDVILVASFLVSSMLVGLYFYYRTQQTA